MGTYNHAKSSIFQDRITVKTWSKQHHFCHGPTRVPKFNTTFSWVVVGRHEQIIYQIKIYKTIFLPNFKVQLATHTKNVVFIILFLTKKCLNLSKIQSKSWKQNSPFPRAIIKFRVSQESWEFQLATFFIYACVLPLGNDVGSLKALDMHEISLKKMDRSISKSTAVKQLRKRWMNNSNFMGEGTPNEWSDKWLNFETSRGSTCRPNFCVYCQIQVLQQQVHKGGCRCVTITFMRFASVRSFSILFVPWPELANYMNLNLPSCMCIFDT